MDKNKIEVEYKGVASIIENIHTMEYNLIEGIVNHFETNDTLTKEQFKKLNQDGIAIWVEEQKQTDVK